MWKLNPDNNKVKTDKDENKIIILKENDMTLKRSIICYTLVNVCLLYDAVVSAQDFSL